MATNTIRLHRVLRAAPERVYRAFLDADAMAKWLPPKGFTGKVHHMDARVGGGYKMSFTNFTTGKTHSFGGQYLELMPHERIRLTDRFDDPNLPGEIQLTVTLKKVSVGTELNILQEGVPDVIPAEACYLGWQESLLLPAELVEGAAAGLTVRARPSGAAVNIIGNNYGTSSYQSAYFGAVPCFVSVGWSWAVQLEPFKQMFIDSGMPMDFIEKLNAAIKDVQHAMSEQEFSKGARLKPAAADTRSNALSALHRLDPIMDNLLRDIHPLSPCGNVRGVWNAITSRNLPILRIRRLWCRPGAPGAGMVSPSRRERCGVLNVSMRF